MAERTSSARSPVIGEPLCAESKILMRGIFFSSVCVPKSFQHEQSAIGKSAVSTAFCIVFFIFRPSVCVKPIHFYGKARPRLKSSFCLPLLMMKKVEEQKKVWYTFVYLFGELIWINAFYL